MKIVKIFLVCWTMFLADNTSAQQQVQCGVPKPKANRLIVRGNNADPQDWPWHAVVLHKNPAPEYACGGTLIHKSYVVTARHCVLNKGTGYPLSAGAVLVQLGVEELYDTGPYFQQHKVLEMHVFEKVSGSGLQNDIAILELRTAVQFNEHVLPVCLVDRQVFPGEVGTVVGFGFTERDEVSPVLKMATMPVIETVKCLRADRTGFGGILDEGIFCAGFLNGTAVCNGDSGGGFFLKSGDVWNLAGIVSFSLEREPGDNRCRQDTYGAFTRVQTYLDWILKVTGLDGKIAHQSKDNSLPRDCGLSSGASQYPWSAVIYYWETDHKYWKAYELGTIISKRYVMIGHADDLLEFDDIWRVIVGRTNYPTRFTDSENIFYYEILHGESLSNTIYRNTSRQSTITLFRTKLEIQFNDAVQPICLPIAVYLKEAQPTHFMGSALQFNRKEGNMVLYRRNSTVVEPSRCVHTFGTAPLRQRDICAEDRFCTWTCTTATFRFNGRHVYLGYKDQNTDCDAKLMLMARVEDHLDWIVANVKP